MRDISMHVLDIAMNSVKANATLIEILISENEETIKVLIKDNGCGMTEDMLKGVLDPFCTSQTSRRVGLGIPLFYENVRKTNGKFNITSSEKKGTVIEAIFNKHHIDCIPIGNVNETILSLITLLPDIDFIYTHKVKSEKYELNTIEIKKILQGMSINQPEIINWLKEDLLNQF